MSDTNIKKWVIEMDANTEKLRKKLEAGELLESNEIKKLQGFLNKIIGAAAKNAKNIGEQVSVGFKNIDTKNLENALKFIEGMFKDINKGQNPIGDWAAEGEKTYKKFAQLEDSVTKLEATTTKLGVDIGVVNQQMVALNTNFEKFTQSYQAFNPDKFGKVKKSATETIVVTKELDNLFKTMGKDTKGIDKSSNKLKGYIALWEQASGKKYTFKVSKDIDSQIAELDVKLENARDNVYKLQKQLNATPNDTKLQKKFKDAQLELAKLYIQVQDFEEKTWGDVGDDFGLELKKIQKELSTILSDFKAETKKITEKMSTIKIELSLPEYKDFANKINNFVDGINAGKGGVLKEVNLTAKIANVKEVESPKGDVNTKPEKKTKSPTSQRLEKEVSDLQEQLSKKTTQLNEWKESVEKRQDKDGKELNDNQIKGYQTQIARVDKEIELLKNSITDYQYLIAEIENNPGSGLANEVRRWQTTEASIRRSQDSILRNTQEWKGEIIKAMTVSADELHFEYGWDKSVTVGAQNLQSALEEYFKDSPVNIKINTDGIGDQIKEAIESKGITLGGGNATISKEDMQSVINGAIDRFFQNLTSDTTRIVSTPGSQVDNIDNQTSVVEDTIQGTKKGTEQIVKYATDLSKFGIDFSHITQSLVDFAKIAVEEKSKGAVHIKDVLSRFGFDFEAIAKGEVDVEKVIQEALMRIDTKYGEAQGQSIINELFNTLHDKKYTLDENKGSGAIISRLLEQFSTLMRFVGVKIQDPLASTKRRMQIDEYYKYAPDGRDLGILNSVRAPFNPNKKRKPPKLVDINKAIEYFESKDEPNEDLLKDLRAVRDTYVDSNTQVDEQAMNAFKEAAARFYQNSTDLYNTLDNKVKYYHFVLETDKGKRETHGGSGYNNIPQDAVIKNIELYPTKTYLDTRNGDAIADIFTAKKPPVEQSVVKNDDIRSVTPFTSIAKEDGGIGTETHWTQLHEQVAKIPELEQAVIDIKTREQELPEIIEQLKNDVQRLTRAETKGVDLNPIGKAGDDIVKIENKLAALQMDLRTEQTNTASWKKQLQENEEYKSYSIAELYDIRQDAEAKKNQYKAYKALESLRNTKNPTKDIIDNARRLASVLNDDTLNEALKTLYNQRLRLDEVLNDTNASTGIKTKNQKLFDRNFNKFLTTINQDAFDALFAQAKEIDIQTENKRWDMAHAGINNSEIYDTNINEANQEIVTSEKKQSKLQSEIDETNKELAKAQKGKADEIKKASDTFKEVKNTLYKEAEGYVKLLQTLDPKSEGYETALAKLQQTIRAIQGTQSIFDKFKEATGKTGNLFNEKETKNIDSWMAKFVTGQSNVLAERERMLADRKDELAAIQSDPESNKTGERESLETKLKNAKQDKQKLENAEKEVTFAKEYNRLLAEEERLLANIAKLKKAGASQDEIAVEQEKLDILETEFNDFLANPVNQTSKRREHALKYAKQYHVGLQNLRTQKRAAEKQLSDVLKKEQDLDKYPSFTQGAGADALRKYKQQVIDARVEEYRSEHFAKLRQKWGGRKADQISVFELPEYDADYKKLDEKSERLKERLKKEIQVIDGKLVRKITEIKDGIEVVKHTETIPDSLGNTNLKATLARMLGIETKKADAQAVLNEYNIAEQKYERNKKMAIRYGQIKEEEIINDKLVQEQEKYIRERAELEQKKETLIQQQKEREGKVLRLQTPEQLANQQELKETKKELRKVSAQLTKAKKEGGKIETAALESQKQSLTKKRDELKSKIDPKLLKEQKELDDISKQIQTTDKRIAELDTYIANYTASINYKPEYIKQEKDATVELQKVTERLTKDKAELAQVQGEVIALEEKYDKIADGTPEKEAALAELTKKRNYAEMLDARIKKERLSATYWAGQADKAPESSTPTATTSTETTTIKGGLFGALADSIINGVREGFKGVSLDPHQSGIATEITLRAIYDLLSGGGAYGEELDRKHAAWQAGHPVVQQLTESAEISSEEKTEGKPKQTKYQQAMAKLSEDGKQIWKDIADAAKATKEKIKEYSKSQLVAEMSKLAKEIVTESNVAEKLKKQYQLTEMFHAYRGEDSQADTLKKLMSLKSLQGIADFDKMILSRAYKDKSDLIVKAGYGIGEPSGDLGREKNPKADYKTAIDIVSQALKEAGYNGNIKNPEKLAAIWGKLDEKTLNAGNYLHTGRKDGIETAEGKRLLDAMLKLKDAATKLEASAAEGAGLSDEDKAQILALIQDYKAEDDRIAAEIKALKGESVVGDGDLEEDVVEDNDNIQTSQTSIAQGGLPAWIQGITSAVQGLDIGTLASMLDIQKQILEGVNIVSRRSASGRPTGATDLYEDFRRILESDKWEGRERARYMDYQTGAISNHITGTDKGLSGEALDRLYENYAKSMTINTQLHSHAGFNEPYFSSQDLSTFVGAKRNKNISKQVLISDKNITLLDLSEVADDKLQELVDTLTNTENDFEKLGEVAKKFGARYETLEFNDFEKDITPQKLTKFLGIKGVESKLNQTETKDAAIQGVAEEAAKEAAQVVQKSTGVAIKTTFERAGLEMLKVIEQTDAKGNKTWSTDASNKYQKHIDATYKDIAGQNLGDVFGKGTEAQKALVEYENHYALLNELAEKFKTADEGSKAGIQAQINELIPIFDKVEKKLLSLIARKDKFLGDDQALDTTFGAKELANPRKHLEKLARQMYGGNVNPGGNVAFGGYKRGQGSGQLFVDVLDGQTKTLKKYVLEVDRATGKVKEYVLAENALSNSFKNVERAMQQNEYVMADIALGDGPQKQAQWMAQASSPLLDAYKKTYAEMQAYSMQLWNSSKAPNEAQLNYLMQLSERVMALGEELQKTTGVFRNFWAQKPDAVIDIDFHEGDTVRTAMERYAKINANANTSKYEFASFDNNKLQYKLTDVEGEVRNVTLVWDELYQKVAIVSDKSIVALDPLVAKIEKYKQVVADAKANEYLLDTDDAKFNTALQEIEVLQQKVKEGTATYDELEAARRRAIKQGSDAEKLAKKNEKLYAGTNELRSAERQHTKILGTLPEVVDKETSKQFQAYQAAYDALIADHQKFADNHQLTSVEVQKELQRDAAAVQKLGKQFLASANEAAKLQEYVDNSGSFINKQGEEIQLGGIKEVSPEEITNLNAAMRAYANEVLGAELAHAKFNPTTKQLTGVIRQNNRVVSDMVVKYNEATGQMYLFQKQERESLSGWPGLIHGFKEKSKAIVQYLASMTSIYRVFGMIRQGITYIKEIDAALTELRKVTDETEETYSKFLDTASKTAYRLGSTLVEVTNATAEFAKLGYSMQVAAEMGEAALVYANVGDGIGSAQEAADSIISTLKGFQLEAEDAMLIVDKFNEVGNDFAITSKGIGDALMKSASALSVAGNTIDESVALITAANEVVQDPDSVGTALKTLTLRIRGAKTELQEADLDVENMANTVSSLQQKILGLTAGRVDIMASNDEFKSTTQILRELASVWDTMTDIQQAASLEALGGKRQAKQINCLGA